MHDFTDPKWSAPLDAQTVLRAIPEGATISGMFLESVAKEARRRRLELSSVRERYVAFRFYPLREHDSHHVGALEGALRYAGVPDGSVRVRARSSSDADLLCCWS